MIRTLCWGEHTIADQAASHARSHNKDFAYHVPLMLFHLISLLPGDGTTVACDSSATLGASDHCRFQRRTDCQFDLKLLRLLLIRRLSGVAAFAMALTNATLASVSSIWASCTSSEISVPLPGFGLTTRTSSKRPTLPSFLSKRKATQVAVRRHSVELRGCSLSSSRHAGLVSYAFN